MKKKLILCGFLLSLILTPTFASAANSQNLSWGFAVGNRFDYTLTVEANENATPVYRPGTYELYFVVEVLREIPETVTSIYDTLMSQSGTSQYFSNGTELPYPVEWIAYPIGNWTLMRELLEIVAEPYEDVTFIDTATEWGHEWTQVAGPSSVTYTVRLSKGDGALTFYNRVYEYDTIAYNSRVELVRKGGDILPVNDLILPIAVVAVGIIVVLAVIFLKKR